MTDPVTPATAPYSLTVTRQLVAQHFLIVPDPGPEGEVHSHRYRIELRFGGESLTEYDYLVDIEAVESILDDLEARYRDALLNDLAEFADANPSVERFARVVGDRVAAALSDPNPDRLAVRIWEDDEAWAQHARRLEP